MKKIFFIILTLFILSSFRAYALDTRLLYTRNKMFDESQEIKALLSRSKDAVLLISMFDSCIMAVSQIDAYFYMLGIIEPIKKEDLSSASLDFIAKWLNGIKKTNELSIKSLNIVMQAIEPKTKAHIEKLKLYFGVLNNQINSELNKIYLLEKATKVK